MRRLLVPAAALALAACAHARKGPPPAAPLPIVRPLIVFEGVKAESLGFTGADLVFRARIENGNPFPLSVVRIDYSLQLEGRPAAAGSVQSAVVVPAPELPPAPAAPPAPAPPSARQADPPAPQADPPAVPRAAPGVAGIDLPVRVRFSAIPGVAAVLAQEGEAAYALAGTVTFMTPLGPVGLPLSTAGRIPVPRLPKVRVERAALRSVSPREVTVEMGFAVTNPNPFPIPAGRIGYGLFLSDREVLRADVVIPAAIPAGESASAGGPVTLSVLKAGRAAARLLIPFASLDVKVKGEAVFEGVPVPLDLGASLLGKQR